METNKAKFRKKAKSISPMPSASAWEKLEEKLDNAPPKRKFIRLFPMLAIAASFLILIGLLFANTVFSGNHEKSAQTASFVETDVRSVGLQQIAIVYKNAGTYQSFYETVAAARKGGILKHY